MDQLAAIIATVVAAAGLAATVLTSSRRTRTELGARIDRVESGLTARIDRLDDRIDSVEENLGALTDRLDDRVYALAAGLAPRLEPTSRDD